MPGYADRIVEVKSQVTDEALVRQRRGQVVAAAVHLFSRQGYYTTTVQAVARQAGVSPGLIYQYVRDKEDLLLLSILDVLDSYANEIPKALEGRSDPLDRCCAAVRAYCRVVDDRREATVLAYRSTKSLSPERRQFVKDAEGETNRLITEAVQACIDAGLFRPIDAELATYQLVMYAHAWALKHWHFAGRIDFETYVAQGLDVFLNGAVTAEGGERLGLR